jgi:hypothetical protein
MMPFAETFWALSAVGAALFFMAGASGAAWRRASALASAARAWSDERDSLQMDRDRFAAEARSATRRLSDSSIDLAARTREADEAAALRRERDAWSEERATLLAERYALTQRLSDAKMRYTQLETRAHALEARTAAERARHLARIEALESARRDEGALPAVIPSPASGTTFSAILDRIGGSRGMRSAVLGDALGLPIASLGEHPESLAGFCGYLGQAAAKGKDFLPLGHIRRIVVEDDSLATLTTCSLDGSDIFVATLTNGPGPELPRMIQILNDASSFIGERNRA